MNFNSLEHLKVWDYTSFIFRLVYEETSHSNFQEHIDFEHMWYRYSFENILKTYLIWMTKYFQVWKWKRFFKIQTRFCKLLISIKLSKNQHILILHITFIILWKTIFLKKILCNFSILILYDYNSLLCSCSRFISMFLSNSRN